MNGSIRVALDYPFPDEKIFRFRAMQDVLARLVDAPYDEFTMQELAAMVDASRSTVSKSVGLLEAVGTVTVRETTSETGTRRKHVAIARDHLAKPDPVLAIPQPEFQRPVHTFLDDVESTVHGLAGIILFGSVARGEADRASDIDLLVIVEDDDEKTRARRTIQGIVKELETRRFDGQRYTYQVLVESVESARRIGDRLKQQFGDGITLLGSNALSALRREVYADGE